MVVGLHRAHDGAQPTRNSPIVSGQTQSNPVKVSQSERAGLTAQFGRRNGKAAGARALHAKGRATGFAVAALGKAPPFRPSQAARLSQKPMSPAQKVGGGLPSAATPAAERSGFRQKAAEIPCAFCAFSRPSVLFRSALFPLRHGAG